MSRERLLVTSFFTANIADIASTIVGLPLPEASEAMPLGKFFLERGNFNQALVIKVALTTILIEVYALTKERQNRFAFSFEKAIKAGNLIYWGFTAINCVQIAAELIPHH